MADSYFGEIRMFAGTFAPEGWALCNGQELLITDNEVLYALIGTTYGGNGEDTFAVPDLRGRVPVHQSADLVIGQALGEEEVALTPQQLPAHTHQLLAADTTGNDPNPSGNVLAESTVSSLYRVGTPNVAMATESVSGGGGSQPHPNRQPYQCVNYIISLAGDFPSRG